MHNSYRTYRSCSTYPLAAPRRRPKPKTKKLKTMLTTTATVKIRLALDPFDPTQTT